jgi:hypothetical protein
MSERFDKLSIGDLEDVSGGEYFRICTGDNEDHDFVMVEVVKTGFVKNVHYRCSICGYEYWKEVI